MAIPRVLHQLWKTATVPERYTAFRETWRVRNPDWTIRLWTDADLQALVDDRYPELAGIYRGYPEPISRADLGRYLVLETHGGVYADLDCECLQPLDPLVAGADFLIAPEPAAHLDDDIRARGAPDPLYCPSFIASRPGHPVWSHVRRRIAQAAGAVDVLDRTGPFLLTRAIGDLAPGDAVTVVPSETIYPFTKQQCWSGEAFDIETWERLTRGASVAHYWEGGWFRRRPAPLDGLPAAVSVSRSGEGPAAVYPQAAADLRVTCVMVTRGWRSEIAPAVESYLRQTYPNRELLVVSDRPDEALARSLALWRRADIRLIAAPGADLEDRALARLAAEHAAGQLVCAWAPGELHDPRRLAIQVQVLQATGAHACYNRRRLAWRPALGRAFIEGDRPLVSSMLALKAFAVAQGWTPALSPDPVATIDAPRLSLAVHGDDAGAAFDAQWPAAQARFEADRCDAVIAEVGKRLPVHLARPPAPARKARKGGPPRAAASGEIVVLTPVKNARAHLPRYLELLGRLDAGGAPLSVAFLEGDSDDGTLQALDAARPGLEARFHRVEIHRRHEGLRLDGPRWAPGVQRQRRAAIARARNHLLSAALGQAAWALWLDVDVADYPPDLLTRLLASGKDIVVPHCVRPDGGSFDLNTFVFTEGEDDPAHLRDGLFQPPVGAGRAYLEDIAGPGPVRVDSVGGTALLIKGDLHRQGLNFPAFSYGGYIETEGLAMMARDMGHACWALPDLRIVHPADPAAPVAGAVPAERPVQTAIRILDASAREPVATPADAPVFVCALGWRSGSTLVQRILMTDPTLAVWGEPLDRIGLVSRITDLLGVVRPDWPPPHHWHTHRPSVDLARDWVANLSPDAADFRAGLVAQLDAWLAAPTRRRGFARWGVKEVRWSADEARVLRWLYPAARFVLVARHPLAAYASLNHLGLDAEGPGYWLRWPDRHIATLEDYGRFWNRMAVGWSRAAGELGAEQVRYEDLVAGRIDMVALGQRLGLRLQPDIALAARVGDDPHTAPLPPEDVLRLTDLTAQARALFGYGD